MRIVDFMRRRNLIIGLIAFSLGSTLSWLAYTATRPEVKRFQDEELGVSMNYDEFLAEQTINMSDREDKIIWRASSEEHGRETLATLRWEDGLQQAAIATKQAAIEVLATGINKSFPARFPDYRLISERREMREGHDAIEVLFDYEGPKKVKIRQRFLALLKDSNTAVYLSAQAPASVFEEQNRRYFEIMFQSLTFGNLLTIQTSTDERNALQIVNAAFGNPGSHPIDKTNSGFTIHLAKPAPRTSGLISWFRNNMF